MNAVEIFAHIVGSGCNVLVDFPLHLLYDNLFLDRVTKLSLQLNDGSMKILLQLLFASDLPYIIAHALIKLSINLGISNDQTVQCSLVDHQLLKKQLIKD